MEQIFYKAGYKYQLVSPYMIQTGIKTGRHHELQFLSLSDDGTLWIKTGYAWDGPTFTPGDPDSSMRPSLVHDALYQLMRFGMLDRSYRKEVDMLFYELLLEDGMNPARAKLWYSAVRLGAEGSSMASGERQILISPKKPKSTDNQPKSTETS